MQAQEEVSAIPEVITLEEEKLQDKKIHSFQVEPKEFIETILLQGEVQANPDKIINISSKVPGKIRKVNFIPGSYVKQGMTLLEIESVEASRLRSKYLTTYSKYNASKKNFERIKALWEMRLASEQEFVNAESEVKALESEWKTDLGNLSMMGIPTPEVQSLKENQSALVQIQAPISGIAISRNATVGMFVEPNLILGVVGDISEVWFIVKIFEKELSKVQEGSKVKVFLNSYPDEEFSGILTYIGSIVDMNSRSVEGRIVLNNKKHLAKIGLFGKAYIESMSPNVLVVPNISLVQYNNQTYVFKEERPGQYRMIEVKTGRVSSEITEILDGISVGDYIVNEGIYYLKARFLKSTFGEEE
ncbi:MAG: efflux RND transporter periplasmic adaptor subunit [Candidatus Pacearchaeota archaeon]